MEDSDTDHLNKVLEEQARAWSERTLVRHVYRQWYRLIVDSLAHVRAPTIELGSGIGKLREVKPDALLTDVCVTRWSERVADAQDMPFDDESVGNFVLLDVFHHLSDPERFFSEAKRTLVPTGRVVIVDPYCSPLSTALYRRFHHERTDLTAGPFERDAMTATAPLESNQARATLIFYRHRREYLRRWPDLPIVDEQRFANIAYPLSGGFTRASLVPESFVPVAEFAERVSRPFSRLLAFRCLVALEKQTERSYRTASREKIDTRNRQ
jgi:SAM-dependent methyltransferase